MRNAVCVDIQKEFEKFSAREKLRNGRRRENIADLAGIRGMLLTGIIGKEAAAAVLFEVAVQAIEERRFACTVPPEQTVDSALLKRKVDIPQDFLFVKFYRQMSNCIAILRSDSLILIL